MNGVTDAVEDFRADPERMSGEELASHLELRVLETLREVEEADCWRFLADPRSNMSVVREVLKEVYLEIVMYQPDSIEAAIASIGQMPRSMPVVWVDEMLHHQVEEFDHGEMALRDYLAFGGDETFARERMQSPSAFAVAAVWRNIAHKRNPYLYLGAVYLFDGLTPIVTDRVMKLLSSRMELAAGLEFISHHATADLEHTASIRQLIVDIANRIPESRKSIAYGYEYFKHVYPLPVWDAAARRARTRTASAEVANRAMHATAAE